ncbi:hypothetical protein, partial [Xenorhabdus sp. IM139775]|uniref:hypothetical protein n=1 Tax=Xenorhabdus sp. IM139775 TaxID=3025876 RepID=UPI003FD3A9DA|nr:hypothetical protein [Xenorhabdus sp. IM139775]
MTNPLKKPILPQEDGNGIIDVSLMQNDFMLIVIDHFDTEKPKEKINILLNDIKVKIGDLYIENPIPPNIHITIPFSKIPNGDYKLVYTVTNIGNDVSYSEPTSVKIINNIPSLKIDFQGKDIFQGSNLFITATYTGDSLHRVAKTNSISLKTNSQITNVEITKYEDDKRQPVVDITNNKIIDYFLVKVKNSSDTSDITLTATTDIIGSVNNVRTYKQHQYTKQDIDPKSLIPIVVGSTIIEDFSPTDDGFLPDKS